jgi:hypothetical protein
MQLKLCYKSYDFKMSLEAMKQFKEATGKDLWFSLLHFLETWELSAKEPTLTRIRKVYEILDFETAAYLFHSMIKTQDKSIPYAEIEDAMYKVGWLPTERDGGMSEPWPIVLVDVAHMINSQFSEALKKK